MPVESISRCEYGSIPVDDDSLGTAPESEGFPEVSYHDAEWKREGD